jgi:hypothetical protein
MGLSLFMFAIGIFTIGIGLRRLKKPFSAWLLAKTPYTLVGAWGGIPLGLGALLWGIAFSSFVTQSWARLLLPVGLIIGLAGPFIMYIFFKPAWLKWLQREHGSVLPILENEAWEIGYNTLDRRINSQQDLEEWVAEVRRKHRR